MTNDEREDTPLEDNTPEPAPSDDNVELIELSLTELVED